MTITNYRAKKIGGSYQAEGTIVSTFATLAGEKRHVFEFDQPAGMLHIFGPGQVEIAESVAAPRVIADERKLPPLPQYFPDIVNIRADEELRAQDYATQYARAALQAAPVQAQEPVVLLTLGGIDGGEYGDNDMELVSSKAVEKLQAQLVRGQNPVVLELFAHSAPVQPVAVPQVEVLLAALNNIAEACNCCGDRSDLAVMAQEALDEYADAAPAAQGDAIPMVDDVLSVLNSAYVALDHLGISKITRAFAMCEIVRIRAAIAAKAAA